MNKTLHKIEILGDNATITTMNRVMIVKKVRLYNLLSKLGVRTINNNHLAVTVGLESTKFEIECRDIISFNMKCTLNFHSQMIVRAMNEQNSLTKLEFAFVDFD